MATTVPRRAWLAAGLTAGLVAGLLLDAFEIYARWRSAGPVAVPAYFASTAAVLLGNPAEGATWGVSAGVLVSLGLAIVWAFGYVWAAQRQRQLVARPLISGLGFGFIVYFVMQAVLVPAGRFVPITIYSFDRDILAYTVFFGLPLALIVARFVRAAG